MKPVLVILALAATPCFAADEFPPTVTGNWHFRAYENGAPGDAEGAIDPRRFRAIDTNGDGLWDPFEIARAFRGLGLDIVMSFDGNGDGYVSLDEVRSYDDGGTGGPDGVLWERVRG